VSATESISQVRFLTSRIATWKLVTVRRSWNPGSQKRALGYAAGECIMVPDTRFKMKTPATTPIGGTFRRGLVLQGGGAKGAFQFGVLQGLREAGIQFDVIAGTSVGALNGAIVAAEAWELGDQMWSNLTLGRAFRWRGLAAIYTFISVPCELYLGWVTTAYDSLLPAWLRHLFHLLAKG
jgi:Patatin-like phospholipase